MKRTALALCLFFVIVAPIVLLTQSNLVLASSETSTPKPSVPEFTVEFVDNSYDVPTTYSIDPYTGENVTQSGYHVERTTLEMTIKNQPFVPYYDAGSGWDISFYYNIRIKGYYSEDWIELYRASDGYPIQSDSDYTAISLGTLGENGLSLATNAKMIDIRSGGQVDFQVEAMIGYVSRVFNPNATGPFDMYPWCFTGERSGWSETQTLTISAPGSITTPTTSPSQNSTTSPEPLTTPSPEPQQSEPFPTAYSMGIVTIIVLILLGSIVYILKRKR
jgi:hypothetical protein